MSETLDAEAIAAIIENHGALHIRRDGLILIHGDGGVYRVNAPIIRHFTAEAVGIDRHAPPDEVTRATEMLVSRAFDARRPR